MRCIDADALIHELKNSHYPGEPDVNAGIGIAIGKVCDAPTIEPERKTGKWIVTSEFEDCCYAKCNQCKVTQVFYYNKPLSNFCPNCGAAMREGEQE